ncbi:class I SAM-dependent methyltransferase [Alcanivorax sp.]|uniref:class I SAM-dependent methyltransferase n=1 Tax=Alcanivorax sp. TaxID=1872427 RepID=UPI000C635591|nr:class I SAM-dependent methyltransferase [Alcanivorax sp.]MBQ23509.1 SAM-dependent methyltransferase [Alcanivorax sp.]
MTPFHHPWGQLALQRWPRRRNETLQAWDNADLYLLNTLAERGLPVSEADEAAKAGATTLVLNDQQGALALALQQAASAGGAVVESSGDSFMAQAAALANGEDNSLQGIRFLWPFDALGQTPDQVIMRVPKSVALLEWQLHWLSQHLPQGVPVWLAGMDKHLPRQLVSLLQRYLGNGRAEYGWKKARLFSAQTPGQVLADTSYPSKVEAGDWQLTVHAGVFAQQQLDIGARFFLDHLPQSLAAGSRVVDLGCGNGVIGLAALQASPSAEMTFCDESWLALESARDNVSRYFPEAQCQFHHGDGLLGLENDFDCILLNPPFHDGHVVGDHVARRLFNQAARALAPGGELRVIGNRHLGYHKVLSRRFGSVTVLGSNAKFVVWRCQDPVQSGAKAG